MKQEKKHSVWQYLKPYKGIIIFYVFLYLVLSSCEVAGTIVFADMIYNVTNSLFAKAIKLSVLCLIIECSNQLTLHLINIIFYKYSNKILSKINIDLARQAFKLNSRTYSEHSTAEFTQRIVNDPTNVIELLNNILNTIISLITSAIILIYIATFNVWITLVILTLILASSLIQRKRTHYRKNFRSSLKRQTDKTISLTNEIVRSEKDIKSTGLEESLNTVSVNVFNNLTNIRATGVIKEERYTRSVNALVQIGTLLILLLGIVFLDKGLITLATYIFVYSNKDSVWHVMWNVSNIADVFTDLKICKERMFCLYDGIEFVEESFGEVELPKCKKGGRIEFKKVGYTYKDHEYLRKKNSDEIIIKETNSTKIFENLSFKIKANTTVAFVGKSGSGKSTILNLMSKMFVVDSGEILFNGVNINDLTKNSLRDNISLVNQFPYIFDTTIRQNLTMAKQDATEEELHEALKSACLDEFVCALPKGLDSRVGEGGIKLSGGERQRLAIARALLRNSSLIIFDESTSSLDNFAQNHVKRSIDNLKGKTTVVIVAHRLSTIKDADKIFFLDNGKIVDSGTFDELFERNATFKTMFMAENI